MIMMKSIIKATQENVPIDNLDRRIKVLWDIDLLLSMKAGII